MLTETQTEALKQLLEAGNNAGAIALLDGIKNQQPQSTIKQALAKVAESKNPIKK